MIRLFRRFDFFIFGWKFFLPIFAFLFFVFLNFNKVNFLGLIVKKIIDFFLLSVFTVKGGKTSKIIPLFLSMIFWLIFIFNFRSLFPFTFSFTTQLRFVLFLSLAIWLRFVSFSFFYNWKGSIRHKIPEGAPLILAIFLFVIEIVREIIRPLTLTLRLVGNIVVGHVLLILLWNLINFYNQTIFIFFIFNSVEIMVRIIQAYIYFTLISMYCREM